MKTYLKSILCLSALLLAAPTYAADTGSGFFFKPYAGADYQFTGVNYEDNIGGKDTITANLGVNFQF